MAKKMAIKMGNGKEKIFKAIFFKKHYITSKINFNLENDKQNYLFLLSSQLDMSLVRL